MTAFSDFLARLEPPHTILGPCDAADVDEMRECIEKLTHEVASLVTALLIDMNDHLPSGTRKINTSDFSNGLADLFGDTIGGPMDLIADRLEAESREDDRNGQWRKAI